jgi:septal ring factor EnvC (AmiA/AmiB activator)
MENIENLAMLEAAVDKLLHAINEMKQEKLEFTAQLDRKNQEITDLQQQLQIFQSERTQIEQRVTGLLGSIEKWEKLNEPPAVVEKSGADVEEKTLF